MTAVLAVTAHPDDETFLFGGALAVHAAATGGRIALLCLTDGEEGRTGGLCAPEELGRMRAAELEAACAVLGIPTVYREQLADRALDELTDDDGAGVVGHYADEFGADVLLTFGPEGASGHPDHKACWRWCKAAAGDRRLYVASFPPELDVPGGEPLPANTVIDVTSLGDRKRRAFLEHKTQHEHLERFDTIQAALAGRELYHRVQPPWNDGDVPATAF